jgi:hypothetical protein
MSNSQPHKPGRKKKPKITPDQIRGARYLRSILDLLGSLHDHRNDPKRTLHYDEYVAYLLLYFFTPVLDSMRGLQQASNFDVLKRKLNLGRFSLGSFSEAGSVFDPQLLQPIIEQLADKVSAIHHGDRFESLGLDIVGFDGTLLHAMPKMVWALWLGDRANAAKMHLEYRLLKGAPTQAAVTEGNASECAVLRQRLDKGKLYVLDRGYADYALMNEILEAESSFLVRIQNNAVCEVREDRPLSPEARAAGIQKDAIVKLGSIFAPELHGKPIRLVEIHVPDTDALLGRKRKRRVSSKKTFRSDSGEYTIRLATDLLDVDVQIIADLYRLRWQIELFFRWFKKVLQADRPLSLKQNGMTIVVYCALIASLLVVLWTGRKPTKRTYEMICFYFLGWVSDAELVAHIQRLQPADR